MRVSQSRIVAALIAIACLSPDWGRTGQCDAAEPKFSVSLVLGADSIQSGEALDVTFILQVKSPRGAVSFLNPFLTDQLPVFARIRVLDEQGVLLSELLTPTKFDRHSFPPRAAWQFFDHGTLVGHQFVFASTDQSPTMAFLKRPGRYQIQAQVLHQMLSATLYDDYGAIAFERLPRSWPCAKSTEVAVESPLVPFEVKSRKDGEIVPIVGTKDSSPYGLQIRIAKSFGKESSKIDGAFYWIENTADSPRILGSVLSYQNPFPGAIRWSGRVEGDAYADLSSVSFYSGGEPRDYASVYVEVPQNGICGANSMVPSSRLILPDSEIIAEIEGWVLNAPHPKIAEDLLKRGRITQAGLDNCAKLTNKDIIATSNRLPWQRD